MELSLIIFTLETYRFCMKCIEFTTRTYNFKNLYEEMKRSDENRSLGNWCLARNFLKKYFDAFFKAQIVSFHQTRHLRLFSGYVCKNLKIL